MISLPDHTIKMDKITCYGQEVKLETPYIKRDKEVVKILNGNPRVYLGPISLRSCKFRSIFSGEPLNIINELNTLVNRRVSFVSTHVGSFDAMIEYDIEYEDGNPNTTFVNFTVDEVKD